MTIEPAIFIHSPEIERISYPPENPFKTWRARRTRELMGTMGLMNGAHLADRPPVAATRQELERYHLPVYLDAMEAAEAGNYEFAMLDMGLGIAECPVFLGMNEYTRLAAGASLVGARALLAGDAVIAFNPSGGLHHAMPDRAAGFCYLNDVALACQVLADAGRRVLYLDVDVHHGDGVQRAFYDRRDVMTISMHQDPATLFPGTGLVAERGVGDGEGFSVNVPLPPETWDDAWLDAFHKVVPPLAHAFDPDVLVVEFGMDGLCADPIGGMDLTNNAYAEVAHWVRGLGKPVLATGGGGYHPEQTARGWALCWSVLTGQDNAQDDLSLGMGGVFLQSSEWLGGLRDRVLIPDPMAVPAVEGQISKVIDEIFADIFPLHGLKAG
jgi:acetoin utilization protein AcuC